MHAERWHAPRLSLYESLHEPEGLQQLAPPHTKGYLLKWDLDITRFHTEDLVCSPSRLICLAHHIYAVGLLTVLLEHRAKHQRNMHPNTCLVLLELEAHSSEFRKIVLTRNAAASHQHHCRLIHVVCECTHVCLLLLYV